MSLRRTALLACGLLAAFAPARAADERPNVVVILADDLGYSDLGCYGGELATPALDRLAREGVRLTRFFNGGMCVATRASLLSGQWCPRIEPAAIRPPILPDRLRAAGYRTALIGKWHLHGHPLDRGFDHFFGFLGGYADHFAGGKDYQLDRAPFREFGPGFNSTDAFAAHAIDFITDAPARAAARRPFFLYLSFQAPHNPLQAPREAILRHRGRYLDGWRATRERRFARQRELGLVAADATLPAFPQNLPDWSSLSPAQRNLEDLRMAVYAAMVEQLDAAVGRVVAALDAAGHGRDTLVLFASDNGADPFSVMDTPLLRAGKLPGDPGSNFQPGLGWASAANTPWRLAKISQHAGGVTSGAIAWWPGRLGAPGRIASAPIHAVDVPATLLALAAPDSPPPSGAGESFLPLLRGAHWQRRAPLYFQRADNRAVRDADWTLAAVDGSPWELYRAADTLESLDLAAAQPAVVARLAAHWDDWWRTETGHAYVPESTRTSPHYSPQGDRGSGRPYVPSAMPAALAGRYPIPSRPFPSHHSHPNTP